MIAEIVERYRALRSDPGFLRFQHGAIADAYDQLAQGYSQAEGEVAMVTRLGETLGGRSYKGLRLHFKKIHGSKSYVSFTFRDKPTTKELGDLAMITVVSNRRRRLLQKLCIVQNKVLRADKAEIDPEQLFLLKNFPLFSGSRGLFRGATDVMFLNREKCLGAYGFFVNPGEMLHINAGVLSDALAGSTVFSRSGTGGWANGDPEHNEHGQPSPFPLAWWEHPAVYEEFVHRWLRRGLPLPFGSDCAPFASSRRTRHDLHDFVRAWADLRVGELVYSVDRAVDLDAEKFSTAILRQIGFGEHVDLEGDNLEGKLSAALLVMVAHLDVGAEER